MSTHLGLDVRSVRRVVSALLHTIESSEEDKHLTCSKGEYDCCKVPIGQAGWVECLLQARGESSVRETGHLVAVIDRRRVLQMIR